MRFRRLLLRGFIGIKKGLNCDEVEVDFTRFSSGLVVLSGSNGSGKSTILENLTPYLQLASRSGALTNHVYLKDSRKELEFDWNNDKVKCVVLLDAKQKTTQAFLYVNDELQNDGKVNTYEEVVNRLFGSPKLFFHSVFSAQHRTPLTELTKGERKELFTELLGLSYLQDVSDAAKRTCELHNGRCLQLSTELARFDIVEKELLVLTGRMSNASLQQKELTSEQIRTNTVLEQAQEVLERLTESCRELDLKVKVMEGRKKERERLLASDKTLQLERDGIRRELDELSALVDELPRLHERHIRSQQVADRIIVLEEQERECYRLNMQAKEVSNRATALETKRESELREKQTLVTALERQIRSDVPCTTQSALFRVCPLLENARSASQQIVTLAAEIQVLLQPDPLVNDLQQEAKMLLENASVLDIQKELAELVKERRSLSDVQERFLRAQNANDRLNVLQPRLRDKELQCVEAAKALEGLQEDTSIELLQQLELSRRQEVEEHTLQVQTLRRRIQEIDRELVGLSTLLQELELQRVKLVEELARLEEKERERTVVQSKMGAWLSISKAFGKDGIQAFELDAAGPKITHLANELLLSAFGSRFTISLETLRYNTSMKVYREVFDVIVHREDGTDQLVETLSGGERVWIETAIAEAIGVLNAMGSRSRHFESVCADEIDGALDADNKIRFLAMVEKSHELGKRYHTFLVTQSETISMSVAQRLVLRGNGIAYEC